MSETVKILLTATDRTKAAFSSVDRNLSKTQKSVRALTAAFGPLAGIASAGVLMNLGKQAIDSADNIQKMSKALDLSTEALSQYQYAAKLSNVENTQLEAALRTMNQRLSETAMGTGEAKKFLEELGVSTARLAGLRADQKFEMIADALVGVEDRSKRAMLASRIFGEEVGAKLLPMIDKGSAGIREMRDEADRLGVTLSQEMADKAAEAADSMNRLNASVSALTRSAALLGAGPLADLLDGFSSQVTGASTWKQYTTAVEDLKREMPGLYEEFRTLQKGMNLNEEASIALIARLREMKRLRDDQGTVYTGDVSSLADGPFSNPQKFVADASAANAALKDWNASAMEHDYLMGQMAESDELIQWWAGIRAEIDAARGAVNAYSEAIGPGLTDLGGQASEFNSILENSGVRAADAFGDAVVSAAMRGGDALQSLGALAESVFGSIISSLISIGVKGLLNPVAAISGVAGVGPSVGGAPMGGNITINGGISVSGAYNMSQDPMAKTAIAQGVYDELRRIGSRRGTGGRL